MKACANIIYIHFLLQDLQGDEVLVSGVNTGTARVQVRLVENAWNVSIICTVHVYVQYRRRE